MDDPEQTIAQAAMKLINNQGFRGVRLRDVAREADLARDQVADVVGDRLGLMILTLNYRDVADIAHVRAGRKGETEPALSGREALYRLVERNVSQPEMIRLYLTLAAEALDPDHPAHGYFLRRYAESREIIADMLEGEVSDPDNTAILVLAVLDGIETQWLYDPDEVDMMTQWNVAADALLGPA